MQAFFICVRFATTAMCVELIPSLLKKRITFCQMPIDVPESLHVAYSLLA